MLIELAKGIWPFAIVSYQFERGSLEGHILIQKLLQQEDSAKIVA